MIEEKKSKGLGDTLQKVITKSGITKYVKIISEDCGCDKRRRKLNEIFPYKK
tara:strand:- start:3670 stop:3825 length:156 start_codon:yes stop_codon:yes gene_type:complete